MAAWSGSPVVGLAKYVYLNVTKLRGLTIHEPSAVPIFCQASLPEPVVAEAVWAKVEPVSSRCDWRQVTLTSNEFDRRDRGLHESFVAHALVVGQFAVRVGLAFCREIVGR